MLVQKCIYPKSIFAKCTRIACLLSFAAFCLSNPSPSRADPNRAAEGCQKTPMEIAIRNAHYNSGYFSILILLAGFVNAETPSHTRLGILREILETGEKNEFVEEFEKNLVGLSVSEVRTSNSLYKINNPILGGNKVT